MDTELNLVTECWVEPQSGYVHSTAENWKHLHGLPYQKIPKAVSPWKGLGMCSIVERERALLQVHHNTAGKSLRARRDGSAGNRRLRFLEEELGCWTEMASKLQGRGCSGIGGFKSHSSRGERAGSENRLQAALPVYPMSRAKGS